MNTLPIWDGCLRDPGLDFSSLSCFCDKRNLRKGRVEIVRHSLKASVRVTAPTIGKQRGTDAYVQLAFAFFLSLGPQHTRC